ncbi:MAG: hypothetical protein K5679_03160 [Lachnospiraceae bacterium]|nr:hypothetical protein [Lachnospiraceae bacterium]
MKVGLVSYRSENKNIDFNLSQIERACKAAEGKAELICFGEAFLQGFDSLCWDYEIDKDMAVAIDSEQIGMLRKWSLQYDVAIAVGFIEKEEDKLYSSYVFVDRGAIVHNYRRISEGWKEFTKTDEHYCEGTVVEEFTLRGKTFQVALCGDMWDFPERFKTDKPLLWPVYCNYDVAEWEDGILGEYAEQANLAALDTLLINPLDNNPVNHGGSFRFTDGKMVERISFDSEEILITEV